MAIEVRTSQDAQTLLIESIDRGRSLADCLARHDMPLNTRCGKRGLCDGCVVNLVDGAVVRNQDGKSVHSNGQPVPIRACEHEPADADATLLVPDRSLLSHRPQVVSQFRIKVPFAHDPIITPSAERHVGVAVDVGTTTVAMLLVELNDGEILGRGAGFNRQMHLGDNVLTRINLCSTEPANLPRLQHAVVHDTIRRLLRDALRDASLKVNSIAGFVFAGNTTMLHLLAGVDPSPMGIAPFTPTFLEHRELRGRDIHLEAFDDQPIHLLPGAAAYVGADLCAGIFSSGLIYESGATLLVDIGTNGEVILKHEDRVLGCATAAGPAFEGAGLTSGMRAADGAISHVGIADTGEIQTEVIGDGKKEPLGLCGSAYIDLLAELRRVGWLDARGRFIPENECDDNRFCRIAEHADARALRVACGPGKEPILLSEPDIAVLLQAKGAIAAGILTLMGGAGLPAADIQRLYLAGGFGMHLDLNNTIACGLLPGFQREQIELVGNTSLAGAYIALLDRHALDEMGTFGRQMELVELNLDPRFEDHYIDQLSL